MKKIDTIQTWPVPMNVTEVQSFLGFSNYYYHFIKGYTEVASPLYALISDENAAHKSKAFQWTDEWQKAFQTIKDLCTSTPILAFADFLKPFKLHTDTIGSGIGGSTLAETRWSR